MSSSIARPCIFCRFQFRQLTGSPRHAFSTFGSRTAQDGRLPDLDSGKVQNMQPNQQHSQDSAKDTTRLPRARMTRSRGSKNHRVMAQDRIEAGLKSIQPYTPEEMKLLALKYTPAQLRAIEAGEKAIDPVDIITQGRRRTDAMTLEYRDDFSRILPVVDKPVRAPDEDIDPDIRVLSEDELSGRYFAFMQDFGRRIEEWEAHRYGKNDKEVSEDIARFEKEAGISPDDGRTPTERLAKLREVVDHGTGPDWEAEYARFAANQENFLFSPKGKINSQSSSLSVDLPKINDPRWVYDQLDSDPNMELLIKRSGMSARQIRALRSRVLVFHRVVNQTRMGKIQGFYSLAIAGNENGMLGIGEGNATEAADSRRKATNAAVLNMKPIPRYENRTIFGDMESKVCASVVQLGARPPGFGNRCQFLIFEMARAAGIKDLAARCVRSKNPMNVVKATYKALLTQKLPEDVARARGMKMVDVRKVYYQGLTG